MEIEKYIDRIKEVTENENAEFKKIDGGEYVFILEGKQIGNSFLIGEIETITEVFVQGFLLGLP